jgi:hypothetical protein
MTPEIIKTISKLRSDFYTSFAAAMEEPVRVSGNSYNSLACIASWVDQNHRLNYLTIYAYLSPDELATERPFILRLSINKGAGMIPLPRQGKMCQGANQEWWFEMTVLPEELLDFVPWVVDLVEAKASGQRFFTQHPPHPINPDYFVSLKSAHFWTKGAEQLMEAHKCVEPPVFLEQPSQPTTSPHPFSNFEQTGVSARRLMS